MSIRWTRENITTLSTDFIDAVLRNARNGSSVAFGQTGEGLMPNYQVVRDDSVATFRGNTHLSMQDMPFVDGNLSPPFSVAELTQLRSEGAFAPTLPPSRGAGLDDRARRLLDAHVSGQDRHFVEWLPSYKKTVESIAQSLRSGERELAFYRVWRERDNSVSNAGRGAMSTAAIERLRVELDGMLDAIRADGSPDNHDAIVAQFEQWKSQGLIDSVPRLIVARAFASIHPDRYHTTVDATRHERVIGWCERHTGFEAPQSASWAHRAAALTTHLGTLPGLASPLLRNMFPWFIELHGVTGTTGEPSRLRRRERSEEDVVVVSRERQIVLQLRENRLQNQLVRELSDRYGPEFVEFEYPTGNGTRADVFVVAPDGIRRLYEIKVAQTALTAVRCALGQLLEYSYLPGGLEADELIVVAEPEFDLPAQQFIDVLRERLGLAIAYRRIVVADAGDGPDLQEGAALQTMTDAACLADLGAD